MLHVGVSSWIIQDGNYRDFRVGEAAKFALEFYPQAFEVARPHQVSYDHIRANRYRIHGQVVYVDRSVWVLDFGVLAYHHRKPPRSAKNGERFEGEIYLGIDPFFYFESLHALPGMPALQYEWCIKTILLETTPWLCQTDEAGRTIFTRDEQRESFAEVAETNAWEDDDGRGHYVLACERIE
jgi:hypothetical protein